MFNVLMFVCLLILNFLLSPYQTLYVAPALSVLGQPPHPPVRFTPTVPHFMPKSPWPLNVPVLSQPPQFSSPLYRLNVPTLLPAMQNGPRHRIAVKRSSAVEIKKPPEEPPAKSTTQSTQSTKSTSLSTTTATSSSTKGTSGSDQLSSASSTTAAHKSAAPAAVKVHVPTPMPTLTPSSGHHEQAASTSLASRAVDSDPHKQDHVVSASISLDSAQISQSVDSQPVQQPWPNLSQVNNSASSIPSVVSSSSSSSSASRSHFVSSSYSSVATVPAVSKSVGLGRGRSLGKLSPPSPRNVGIGRGLAVSEGWHTIRNRRNPATVPQNFPPIGSGAGLDII